MLGLRFCARAFSSCGERGPLFITVRGPLTIAASPVAGHRLQTRRLSSCGSRAQLLRGTWDLPRPGLEPVSSALAGRFSTTAPPGKPGRRILNHCATREAHTLLFDLNIFGWSSQMVVGFKLIVSGFIRSVKHERAVLRTEEVACVCHPMRDLSMEARGIGTVQPIL